MCVCVCVCCPFCAVEERSPLQCRGREGACDGRNLFASTWWWSRLCFSIAYIHLKCDVKQMEDTTHPPKTFFFLSFLEPFSHLILYDIRWHQKSNMDNVLLMMWWRCSRRNLSMFPFSGASIGMSSAKLVNGDATIQVKRFVFSNLQQKGLFKKSFGITLPLPGFSGNIKTCLKRFRNGFSFFWAHHRQSKWILFVTLWVVQCSSFQTYVCTLIIIFCQSLDNIYSNKTKLCWFLLGQKCLWSIVFLLLI